MIENNMKIYFVRGGCPDAPKVAEAGNMLYGIRNDYTAYAPVKMLDVNWKSYQWAQVVARAKELRPNFVILPDYEHPHQRRELWARYDLMSRIVPNVGIVAKFKDAIHDIPSEAILCLSIPAPSYAGSFDELPYWRDVIDRDIHLLGGSPKKQYDFIKMCRLFGGRVVSTDGNYLWLKAASYGQWFNGRKWKQAQGISTLDLALRSAPKVTEYLLSA